VKKEVMNKKGQIFLIAAIIFAVAIYSVAIEYNTLKEYPSLEDYKDISENYQNEYPKVVNYAVYSGQDVKTTLETFNTGFLKEAQKKDPNFGAFYAYKDTAGNIRIVNTLNNKVLNVNYQGVDGNQVTLKLLSSNTAAPGEICVNGIGCSSTGSSVGDYDSSYYVKDFSALPTRLEITIPKEGGSATKIIRNLKDFTSYTYLTSSEPIDLESNDENIKVSIQQY
jgi:hypothetical protein